jgi:hypothetical protein
MTQTTTSNVIIERAADYNKRMLNIDKNLLFRTEFGTMRKAGYVVSEPTGNARYFTTRAAAEQFAQTPEFTYTEYGTNEGRMNS